MPPPRDLAPNQPPSEITAATLPPPEIGAATPCPILGSCLSSLTRTSPQASPRDHRLTPSVAVVLAQGSGPSGTGPTRGCLSRPRSQWRLWSLDPRGPRCAQGPTVSVEASDTAASSVAFLPEGNPIIATADLLYVAGTAGRGLSLHLIHQYVTPIKRFL
jgi:hypothetical protein